MSAVQFVPKTEARPGDRVRERGISVRFEEMPLVVSSDSRDGVFVGEGKDRRLVAFEQIEAVVRPVQF